MPDFGVPRPSPAQRRHAPEPRPSTMHAGLAGLQAAAGDRAVAGLIGQTSVVAQRATELGLPPFTAGFTPREQDWIDEVWHHPGIQLMFIAYGELPTPVLARVKEITGDPDAEGVHHNEPEPGQADVEIADTTYDIPVEVEEVKGNSRAGTDEEEFKSTLIHELFHFVENNTKSVDSEAVTTPETLRAILVEPRLIGLPQCAFGWVSHGGGAVYIDEITVGEVGLGDEAAFPEGSPEINAKREKRYEPSPDPR